MKFFSKFKPKAASNHHQLPGIMTQHSWVDTPAIREQLRQLSAKQVLILLQSPSGEVVSISTTTSLIDRPVPREVLTTDEIVCRWKEFSLVALAVELYIAHLSARPELDRPDGVFVFDLTREPGDWIGLRSNHYGLRNV